MSSHSSRALTPKIEAAAAIPPASPQQKAYLNGPGRIVHAGFLAPIIPCKSERLYQSIYHLADVRVIGHGFTSPVLSAPFDLPAVEPLDGIQHSGRARIIAPSHLAIVTLAARPVRSRSAPLSGPPYRSGQTGDRMRCGGTM